MQDIKEVYAEAVRGDDDYFWGVADYNPLLKSLGEIILQVDDKDYEGDSRILFQKGSEIGLLIFGWGSCSGCDALQACDSYEEVETLRAGLVQEIKWLDQKAMLEYMEGKDWGLDYAWQADETKRFIWQAITMLKGELNQTTD